MEEGTRILTETGKVTLLKTYHYYDCPRLFSCVDSQGQKYIGLWVDVSDNTDVYLYVPVSDERLADIEAEKVTLTEMINSELGWVWEVKEIGDKELVQ